MSLTHETNPAENIIIPTTPAPRRQSLWRNWEIASLMCAIAITYIGFGIVSPLRTLYARSEGASPAEAGLMAAAFLFSGFVFIFPFGWLSDRVNRVWLITGGLMAHGLITFSYLFATSGETFIFLRFIEGISAAAVVPAARAMLADLTPPGRNGEAFGLLGAMMTFGMFAGPPIGTTLAEWFGFTLVYWLSAVVFVPAIILVLVTLRRYKPKTQPKTAAEKRELPQEKLWTTPIIIGCIVRGALGLGPGVAIAAWSLFMTDLGYSLTFIGLTYMVYAIPMVIVGPIAGRLSDRVGRLWMMFGAAILVSLCWMSYGIITAFLVILVLGVIEGTMDGIARSANDGYLADHSPAHSHGKAQGLFNAVTQFGSLAGALAGGFLYELGHNIPFLVVGAIQVSLVLLALGLLVATRKKVTSNK